MQGVVGNERSNLLSAGCEYEYCCSAVAVVNMSIVAQQHRLVLLSNRFVFVNMSIVAQQ